MYQIYRTAYRISDEMKLQKENEKPFWWEHLHAEVREQSLEDIDKMLLEAGVPSDVVATMDRKEKYLAVSEGCYKIDSEEHEKKLSEAQQTSFLNRPNNNVSAQTAGMGAGEPSGNPAPPSNESGFAPLGMDPPSQDDINTPPKMGASADNIDDEIIKNAASQVSDDHLKDDYKAPASPFNAHVNDVGGAGQPNGGFSGGTNAMEIRKAAQSIVRETVNKINSKADSIPETISPDAEQALLRAVADELNALRHS